MLFFGNREPNFEIKWRRLVLEKKEDTKLAGLDFRREKGSIKDAIKCLPFSLFQRSRNVKF